MVACLNTREARRRTSEIERHSAKVFVIHWNLHLHHLLEELRRCFVCCYFRRVPLLKWNFAENSFIPKEFGFCRILYHILGINTRQNNKESTIQFEIFHRLNGFNSKFSSKKMNLKVLTIFLVVFFTTVMSVKHRVSKSYGKLYLFLSQSISF